jgi:hypothetical protein
VLRRVAIVLALGTALAAGLVLVLHQGPDGVSGTALAQTGMAAPGIVRICSQGSVLAADGQVWVYRPDQDRWMTIDQAFREEGRETHIVPLPVPVSQIKEMESFGFLLTQGGEVWFYEISSDKWRKLPHPA